MNCDIACVSNGIQLIEMLLKRNEYQDSTSDLPDLIIMDLNIPLMDGYDAFKRIRVMKI